MNRRYNQKEWEVDDESRLKFKVTCWHEAGHALALHLLAYKFEYATAVDLEKNIDIKGCVSRGENNPFRTDCDALIEKSAGVVAEMLRDDPNISHADAREKGWTLLNKAGNTDRGQMIDRLLKYPEEELDGEGRKQRILDHLVIALDLIKARIDALSCLASELEKGLPLSYAQAVVCF